MDGELPTSLSSAVWPRKHELCLGNPHMKLLIGRVLKKCSLVDLTMPPLPAMWEQSVKTDKRQLIWRFLCLRKLVYISSFLRRILPDSPHQSRLDWNTWPVLGSIVFFRPTWTCWPEPGFEGWKMTSSCLRGLSCLWSQTLQCNRTCPPRISAALGLVWT